MSPSCAPIDIPALTPRLRLITRRLGRYFPEHLMDVCDLTQTAYLGILSVLEKDGETEKERIERQLLAGRLEIIDALRSFRSRYTRRHQLEVLVADINSLADTTRNTNGNERAWIRAHDLQMLMARLSTRDQIILLSRLRGETMAEIGERLGITEGRVSQLTTQIVAELQEVI